ncbi:uncharacterized protein LOC100208202 isoform X1 [Hydra vulgaris]|uniref:uncharacterized protein LOC100208202 isoform X1 n=1 Tax=Hydra vulgaris TaxID=6087 RepID=UPI001F5F2564|nr:uncharacterized protein LOC100208202 [Hydra vulgaris]
METSMRYTENINFPALFTSIFILILVWLYVTIKKIYNRLNKGNEMVPLVSTIKKIIPPHINSGWQVCSVSNSIPIWKYDVTFTFAPKNLYCCRILLQKNSQVVLKELLDVEIFSSLFPNSKKFQVEKGSLKDQQDIISIVCLDSSLSLTSILLTQHSSLGINRKWFSNLSESWLYIHPSNILLTKLYGYWMCFHVQNVENNGSIFHLIASYPSSKKFSDICSCMSSCLILLKEHIDSISILKLISTDKCKENDISTTVKCNAVVTDTGVINEPVIKMDNLSQASNQPLMQLDDNDDDGISLKSTNKQRNTDKLQWSTDESQRSTDKSQKSTDESQRSTDKSQKSTYESQRSTDKSQKCTDGSQMSTEKSQKSTGYNSNDFIKAQNSVEINTSKEKTSLLEKSIKNIEPISLAKSVKVNGIKEQSLLEKINIQLAPYMNVLQEGFNTMMKIYNADETTPGWRFTGAKDGVRMFRCDKDEISEAPTFKGTGVINVPLGYVIQYVSSLSFKSEYDKMFESGTVVEVFCDNLTKIFNLKYVRIWPVSGRDFCSISIVRHLKDNMYGICVKAVEHPGCPAVSSHVRGNVLIGGFLLKVLSSDPPETELTYLARVELGGYFPQSIINKISAEQSMFPAVIRKHCEHRFHIQSPVSEEKKILTEIHSFPSWFEEKVQDSESIIANVTSNDLNTLQGNDLNTSQPCSNSLKTLEASSNDLSTSQSNCNGLNTAFPKSNDLNISQANSNDTSQDNNDYNSLQANSSYLKTSQANTKDLNTSLSKINDSNTSQPNNDFNTLPANSNDLNILPANSNDLDTSQDKSYVLKTLQALNTNKDNLNDTSNIEKTLDKHAQSFLTTSSTDNIPLNYVEVNNLVDSQSTDDDQSVLSDNLFLSDIESIKSMKLASYDSDASDPQMNLPRDRFGQIDFITLGNQTAASLEEEFYLAMSAVSLSPLSPSIDSSLSIQNQNFGWVYQGSEKDVILMKKIHSHLKVHSFFGRGVISVPPDTVFKAVSNPVVRTYYDNMLKKISIVRQISERNKIVYMLYETNKCFVKQARDFCVLHAERKEEKRFVLAATSVEIPDCPTVKDIVRGRIYSSGWIIEPLSKEGMSCSMVTYISQVDFGGRLPTRLVNYIGKRQPLGLAYLRKYLESSKLI